MSIPIILPKVLEEKEINKELRKLKLKKSDIKNIYQANSSTLIVLKKRVKIKPTKSFIPSIEEEEEIKYIHKFVEEYKYLIELERVAEISAQISEIKGFSGIEREIFGRAILDLKGQKQPKQFNLYFVKFGRNKIIDTEIASGDIVLISRGEPLKSDITGTVSEVKKHFITVAFENMPPKWVYSYGIRVDLYINDITFKRMEENLEILRNATGKKRYIRNIALGLKEPEPCSKSDFEVFNERLNDSQKEAAKFALGSKDVFLIHGPPGTGKTSTLIEIILQEVKRGNKVLAVADSNIAVDNMLLRLSDKDISLVRIGHPARIIEKLHEFSIHAKYEKSFEAEAIKKGWEEVGLLVKKREEFSKPTASRSRGMSFERILTLAARGKSQRGVSVKTLQSMAKWIKYNRKIEDLINRLRMEEEEAYKNIIKTSDVVLSTNSMIMSEILKDFDFDVAIIDEGSQQIVPSTFIPIMHAKRFIIAGDHKQLPPTVVSDEAQKLKKSLFEELIENFPKNSKMLKVQYRMNEKIMNFSNQMFYDGELIADESVKEHTLNDFDLKKPKNYEDILDNTPIVFVNTKGIEARESLPDRSTSYENVKEAEIAINLVKELLNMGMKEDDIGVISPYLSQVKRIKSSLHNEEILVEVKSVDGFQGREKEVIIISFVRSNEEGNIGFLKDLRRLNVAITRAKRKLICIGDENTLNKDETYKKFIEYIEKEGKIVNL
ncbi:IGHMBP2 family helicase [Nitrosophilus kaiyonis]|uniref:IGHMBP2 family helicase n=1 Tax=Nitrosophilus kaiyonis TaxID=2930200 RepID=UPI0024902FC6|nr:IGHMBP2 family helicase [Nitrosophilus kaiyonis]